MGNVIANRLKEVRDVRKLSQSALAKRAGLQPSAISHFETSKRLPSVDNLRRLADALDVSTDYLLGRSIDSQRAAGPGPKVNGAMAASRRVEAISDDAKVAIGRVDALAEKVYALAQHVGEIEKRVDDRVVAELIRQVAELTTRIGKLEKCEQTVSGPDFAIGDRRACLTIDVNVNRDGTYEVVEQ